MSAGRSRRAISAIASSRRACPRSSSAPDASFKGGPGTGGGWRVERSPRLQARPGGRPRVAVETGRRGGWRATASGEARPSGRQGADGASGDEALHDVSPPWREGTSLRRPGGGLAAAKERSRTSAKANVVRPMDGRKGLAGRRNQSDSDRQPGG